MIPDIRFLAPKRAKPDKETIARNKHKECFKPDSHRPQNILTERNTLPRASHIQKGRLAVMSGVEPKHGQNIKRLGKIPTPTPITIDPGSPFQAGISYTQPEDERIEESQVRDGVGHCTDRGAVVSPDEGEEHHTRGRLKAISPSHTERDPERRRAGSETKSRNGRQNPTNGAFFAKFDLPRIGESTS